MSEQRPEWEERVRAALVAGAEGAPDVTGAADGARQRLRRKRRTAVAAGVAAVVVIATPLALLTHRDGGGATVAGSAAPSPATPTQVAPTQAQPSSGRPSVIGPASGGVRTESWHDVTLTVPAGWRYAGPCPDFGSREPAVRRPSDLRLPCPGGAPGVTSAAAGVTFSSGGTAAAATVRRVHQIGQPAYLGRWSDGAVTVTVRDDTEQVVGDVLGSVRRFGAAPDPNGCYADVRAIPGDATNPAGVSICRYDKNGDLEQSESLSDRPDGQASAALAALHAAPEFPQQAQCAIGVAAESFVWLTPDGEVTIQPRLPDCAAQIFGATGAANGRMVTAEVMYWTLSPGWFGTFPPSVPMPSDLR